MAIVDAQLSGGLEWKKLPLPLRCMAGTQPAPTRSSRPTFPTTTLFPDIFDNITRTGNLLKSLELFSYYLPYTKLTFTSPSLQGSSSRFSQLAKMTVPQAPPTATFNVPTIDIAPYLLDPSSTEALKVVNAVRTACTTTGFFQLVGHGISRSLQDAVFKGSEALFKLPMEEKVKMDRSQSIGASNRGYELIGGQGLQEDTLPDLKEGFYVGQEIPATDPRVQRNAFLMGPNLWPNPCHISEEVFRKPMSEYYAKMYALSLQVMDVLAAGMPYGPNVFDEFCDNDAVASIRLLHYPPDKSNDERQLGAGAHTDFGAITLLLQDETGGLQVWDGEGKRWVDVLPNRDAYVVNVGDMLQMWTGGKYKSNLHRVVNRGGSDRYSVPFFFDGNVDCVLKPLDGSNADGEHLTVEQHMKERFASTYGRGKKREDGEGNFKA